MSLAGSWPGRRKASTPIRFPERNLGKSVKRAAHGVSGRGTLQGLGGGLSALGGRGEAGYLSSCDVPFLRASFARRMIDLLEDRAICVPFVDGFHHPLAAVYRVEIVNSVTQLLSENRLRPVFLFETASTRIVQARELIDVDPGLQSLRNLNTVTEN